MLAKEGRKLEGQVAIITGASSGIGAGVATAFARSGARVVINYSSSEEKAKNVLEEVSALKGEGFVFKADVSKEAEVKAMFTETINRWGTVDILVNNAGLQKDSPFHEMSLEEWNKVLAINLTGQFLCAREAVKEYFGFNRSSRTISGDGRRIMYTGSAMDEQDTQGESLRWLCQISLT